jgi:hypothetical protein
MKSAAECMAEMQEMDAKVAECTDPALAIAYGQVAAEWRELYDQAFWRNSVQEAVAASGQS